MCLLRGATDVCHTLIRMVHLITYDHVPSHCNAQQAGHLHYSHQAATCTITQ
jgi:hypothetical protein